MIYVQTLEGTDGLLEKTLSDLLPNINDQLSAKVQSASPPIFHLVMGKPDSVLTPTIAVYSDSGQNDDLAQRTDRERVYMVVDIFIPPIAENAPSQIEKTKITVLDMVKSALSTLSMQAPTIVFKSDGTTWRGIRSRWSNWASLWDDRMPDKVTIIKRFQLRWWIDYQIDLS